uniref:Uncharacterized protein n=1 Tax=Strongyloides papillosus TaxID=174720 RepID=A0A0N5BTI5_STREA
MVSLPLELQHLQSYRCNIFFHFYLINKNFTISYSLSRLKCSENLSVLGYTFFKPFILTEQNN